MPWYFIVLIIIGYIISAYITGLLIYVNCAKIDNNINLLKCDERYIKTDKGILDVNRTLDNLYFVAFFGGVFFPIIWSFIILTKVLIIGKWILSPITNYIMNK